MQVTAAHCDDYVQVELHDMRDALFDAEVVGFGAPDPGEEF